MELKNLFHVATVLIISISNAHSKGSPWDWQSMNAKYPSDDTAGISRSISKSSHRSAEANFPKIQPVNANISVYEGHTALLPCRIKHLKEYTVSWLRGRDTTVLSVGLLTFSSDSRFRVMRVSHNDVASDWSLEIKAVNSKDEGWYDCQVNTEPKINFKSYLKVMPKRHTSLYPSASTSSDRSLQDAPDSRPKVIPQIQEFLQTLNNKISIAGPTVLWKKQGEILNLECKVKHQRNMSPNLIWAHNGRVIQHKNNPKYHIQIDSQSTQSTLGLLRVSNLQVEDKGTYECFNKELSASVQVVIGLEKPGPVAMAQQTSLSNRVTTRPAAENELNSRLSKIESRLELLESQVQNCQTLLEPEGAETLATRGSSNTIVHTTAILTVSILLSVLRGRWLV